MVVGHDMLNVISKPNHGRRCDSVGALIRSGCLLLVAGVFCCHLAHQAVLSRTCACRHIMLDAHSSACMGNLSKRVPADAA